MISDNSQMNMTGMPECGRYNQMTFSNTVRIRTITEELQYCSNLSILVEGWDWGHV
jgi:hypothetical protein